MGPGPRVLMIRLGAMGDVIHAMPAAHSLRSIGEGALVSWAVEKRWLPLMEGREEWRPLVVDRSSWSGLRASLARLREQRFDVVVDVQGLLKSALVAWAAGAERRVGFVAEQCRERLAARFYSERVRSESAHVIDRYLDVAVAAGGRERARRFSIPEGRAAHALPKGPYVLCSPLAGWRAKQWPFERYTELARWLESEMGLTLVTDMPRGCAERIERTFHHESDLAGLIYATRRATAVVGLDSGPMHLAAALGIPGVALFGPTDPARNGPAGDSMRVLREEGAETSYQRREEFDKSMTALSVDRVYEALRDVLRGCA